MRIRIREVSGAELPDGEAVAAAVRGDTVDVAYDREQRAASRGLCGRLLPMLIEEARRLGCPEPN